MPSRIECTIKSLISALGSRCHPRRRHEIITKIHEGLCEAHVGPRMLARKAILLGYFKPTIQQDSRTLMQKCPLC